ncbi:hypothetical protein AVEN_152517-1 [Araneus ventricosus]|uniref:Uncharacterized protein n=1 Tax=Araneus ventricosus TaxID=182803 RepID=A0A4Y2RAG5_ARAVE|nr:hypothetical protein AVEN_205721-1 [Araneus ventricosus]GBN72232.1 hypothetical protein AVEN_58006-1 [Araneus ventricosus]GBN72249.1 hypothetical protein AVEN_110542-1 [Araneus ventricosus]GBN72254.1 hypothetical protein AVEN_152517-1 [Araneus ventricosus]
MWRCARSAINTTFNTFILPLMTYCCEAIITASQLVVNKLEVLQNKALCLITGAVKSTPIDPMLLRSGNKPFQDIMKEKALALYEKLLRIEDTYWREYIIKPRQHKTQNGFIQKILDIRKQLAIPDDIQPLLKPGNPL